MDKLKSAGKGAWDKRPIHRDNLKPDIKGRVTGTHGKKDSFAYAHDHASAPLSTLRDPDSFGAPPRHRAKDNYDANGQPISSPASSNSGAGGSAGAETNTAVAPTRHARYQPPPGGWGAAVPTPRSRQLQQEQEAAEEPPAPPEPYRKDTTGLRTDNLPKPPVKRIGGAAASGGGAGGGVAGAREAVAAAPAPPPRRMLDSQSPVQPPAHPSLPPRNTTPKQVPAAGQPPPSLPPRMNDHPDEHTPPPPPPYQEATKSPAPASNPALINQAAASRLGQAGISVPGFGIGGGAGGGGNAAQSSPSINPATISRVANSRMGQAAISTAGNAATTSPTTASPTEASPSTNTGHPSQLSELQQRFSKMGTGNGSTSPSGGANVNAGLQNGVASLAAAAHNKKPPPPPPKKASLTAEHAGQYDASTSAAAVPTPPPLPLGSKPRPS